MNSIHLLDVFLLVSLLFSPLTLRADPVIGISPDTLDFGEVAVGQVVSGEVEISNFGLDALIVNHISSTNPVFDFSFNPDPPFQIASGFQIALGLLWMPSVAGFHEGDLLFLSNDPVNDTVRVHLIASVIECPPFPVNFFISESVPEGDSLTIEVEVGDPNVVLDFECEIEYLDGNVRPSAYQLGDTLFTADVTEKTPTQDQSIQGIEYDGSSFWAAGANLSGGSPQIYRFDNNWNFMESLPQPTVSGNLFGFSDIVEYFSILYGIINNQLFGIDLLSGMTISQATAPASGLKGLTLDSFNGNFWAYHWTDGIYVFDLNGITIAQLPYTGPLIYGFGWDEWSPEGPFLWAWVAEGGAQGPNCTAVQFDPAAGVPTGVSFTGVELNGDPSANDNPAGATVDFTNDQLTLLAVQSSNRQPGDGHDFAVGYSLGYERYDWINLTWSSDTLPPCHTTTIKIMLYGIPGLNGDLNREANIIFHTNDPVHPEIIWPVEMTVLPPVEIGENRAASSGNFKLYQNYPNPFNPVTAISYRLPTPAAVTLKIYNALGQEVRTLLAEFQTPGFHQITWDGRDDRGQKVGSGVYIYRLQAVNASGDSGQSVSQCRKMLLLR